MRIKHVLEKQVSKHKAKKHRQWNGEEGVLFRNRRKFTKLKMNLLLLYLTCTCVNLAHGCMYSMPPVRVNIILLFCSKFAVQTSHM